MSATSRYFLYYQDDVYRFYRMNGSAFRGIGSEPNRKDLKNNLSAHGGAMNQVKMLRYDLYALRFRRCMRCPKPQSLFLIYMLDKIWFGDPKEDIISVLVY